MNRKERIIARGEHSNHCHVVTGDAVVKNENAEIIIEAGNEGAVLRHLLESNWLEGQEVWTKEHHDIQLNKGTYKYIPQKEYNPFEIEGKHRGFWERTKLLERARLSRDKGKAFYLSDTPLDIGADFNLNTARSRVIKDALLRYTRLCGYNVTDRPGFLVHGPGARRALPAAGEAARARRGVFAPVTPELKEDARAGAYRYTPAREGSVGGRPRNSTKEDG